MSLPSFTAFHCQIGTVRSSRKVIKRASVYYSEYPGSRFFLDIEYHRKKTRAIKNRLALSVLQGITESMEYTWNEGAELPN